MTGLSAFSGCLLGTMLVVGPATAETAGDRVSGRAVVNDRVAADSQDPWPERRAGFADGVMGLADVTYSTLTDSRAYAAWRAMSWTMVAPLPRRTSANVSPSWME